VPKITPGIEEYLEALFHLQKAENPISTKELSQHLRIAASSVTEMLKKLSDQKLVSYVPYRGVTLTKNGRQAAAALVRRHRLSERFLADMLGLPWEDLHEEACKFEHVISEKVEQRLFEALGRPKTCPHGNPIPSPIGEIEEETTQPLSTLRARDSGVITKITNENPDFLHYLSSLGLFPKVHIQVDEVAPFNGPILVSVGHATYALGRGIASQIWIRKTKKRTL
jgi:DtxR family Mn-dependent transcriptional regulator